MAGNALGKAYSFPGLQKYLQVNYDPARDNQKLAEIVQSTRQQHSQSPQQTEEPVLQKLELHSPNPSPEPVEDQPPRERKPQQVWSPQYGIPAVQDLIKTIPAHPFELQAETPDNAHRQSEQAQANYQQWALQARAIYRVEEPKDVDQRIAFLMHERQQSPNQITQVLAQSPAVQELLKRSPTYVQSYSEFCQFQASDNRATWQPELDQYLRAVEAERQRREQRQLIQQQIQREGRETAQAVQDLFRLTGTRRQPDGSLILNGTNWRLKQLGNTVKPSRKSEVGSRK